MKDLSRKIPLLAINNLHAGIDGREIIKGLNLTLYGGETHVLMGPNGSGKSTLSNALSGHPKYTVTAGSAELSGEDLKNLSADERAKRGLFMAFQYPVEITGVSFFNFLRTAYGATHSKIDYKEFAERVRQKAQKLKMDAGFLNRFLNEGFSGGEKKKAEVLQLLTLEPKVAVLDETDSGLDIDALKVVAKGINDFKDNKESSVLLITHYFRILKYVKPDFVHVMIEGRIVKSGGPELAGKLEEKGYGWVSR